MSETSGARPALVFNENGLLMRLTGCPSCGALVPQDLAWAHVAAHEQVPRTFQALVEVQTVSAGGPGAGRFEDRPPLTSSGDYRP